MTDNVLITDDQPVRKVQKMGISATSAPIGRSRLNLDGTIQLFIYLQMLDFLTTLVGCRVGAAEASPFVAMLMRTSGATGLFLSKLLALAIAAVCIGLGRRHLVRWASYWYAVLVLWNVIVILKATVPVPS